MLRNQPETQNVSSLSDSNVKHEVWLSEPDSNHERTRGRTMQVADISKHTLHSPSKYSSMLSGNFAENVSPEVLSDISKPTSETSSKPEYSDVYILSLESYKETPRLSEDSSVRFIPSKENANITNSTLEAPTRPRCRDGSSISSASDEEASRIFENSSTRIDTYKENADVIKNKLETPSRPTCRDGSNSSFDSEAEISSMSQSVNPSEGISNNSRNTFQTSLAPTCTDGSSMSLYYEDETASVSETAIVAVGYSSETSSNSSESDVEDENALSQLPQNLIAQTPQVLVDNSSDVHIGPKYQYTGPITVKQYITVSGKDAIEDDNSVLDSNTPTQMPHLKDIVDITLKPQGNEGNINNSNFTDKSQVNNINKFVISANCSPKLPNNLSNLNNGVKMNGIDIPEDLILSRSKDTLLATKKNLLKKQNILICAVMVAIMLCISITLALVLPEKPQSSETIPVKPQNINMTCKFKDLRVLEGTMIQWVVDIKSRIGRLNVDWYGPGCKYIEQKDGPSKYEIDNVYLENGMMQTVLKVLDVKKSDRGLYKLHVYNDEDEQWDYFTLAVLGGGHVVACYVAEWAHLRIGQGMFTVDDIDPTLCTHLLFAFANLNTTSNTIYPADPKYDLGSEQEKGAYMKITSLKKKHPHLKVLISMGGWAERVNNNYSIVAESPVKRKEAITSIVEFISKYNFDGLDLHWQYPTEQNGVPADKENFVYLVKELREAFDRVGKNWLLTAPIGVMPNTIQGSYNIPEITKYLHYMFVLCYAYHGFWEMQTGPNAPLYRSKAGDELNVQASIQKLLKLGAQKEKIVLGLALNGRSFILENENASVGFGAPTVGNGFTGPYVQETGSWGYNEICYELGQKHSNWVVHWDNVTRTPYMTYKKKFMSYDNEQSLTEKVDFALSKGLAGVVTYSLDTDDFRGVCAFDNTGITNYPLMRAINKAFNAASYGPMKPCKNTHELISQSDKAK